MLIKICGIGDLNTAEQAAGAGAHLIGIIFHPPSRRNVALDQAREIAAVVKKAGSIPVAVFVNQSAPVMHSICEATNITTIQLHGENARNQHHLLPKHYQRIYVVKNQPPTDCNPDNDFLLFDHAIAGGGKPFDWNQFNYTGDFRWILAGGLSEKNVATAIQKLRPDGVDVSSGVENISGNKDISLIKQFIQGVNYVT